MILRSGLMGSGAVRPKGERPSLDGEDQFRSAGRLAVHRGGAGTDAHRTPALREGTFQLQNVSGDDLPLEAGVFHPAEEGNFPLISGESGRRNKALRR